MLTWHSHRHDADSLRGGVEDFEACAFGKEHLKRVRPGHADKLPALESHERLLRQGCGQVANDGARRNGDRILANAAT